MKISHKRTGVVVCSVGFFLNLLMHQVTLYRVMPGCGGGRAPAETAVGGQQTFTCAAASVHCLASDGP